jgi:glycerate kinase
MKVVIAVDSFKGSLSSADGAAALAEGIRTAEPSFEVVCIPIADGGEGTLDAVQSVRGGERIEVDATDPLGRPHRAPYLLLWKQKTAVVELAQASGLPLLEPGERDPLKTTTLGTGQVIRSAIEAGARRIVIGVGGSATNDGGVGLSTALGARFLDAGGEDVAPVGETLLDIEKIDLSAVPRSAMQATYKVATDVRNPLCGPLGAAQVYGPQKGADEEAVERLDQGLEHLAGIIDRFRGTDVAHLPGAGAAGGVGACLAGLFNAEIVSGFDAIAEVIGLDEVIAGADVVITGEGKLDGQTLSGKVPYGVARRAREHDVPVFAVAGEILPEAESLRKEGIDGFFPIVSGPMSLEHAMANAFGLMRTTGRRIGYLLGRFGR